MAPSLENSPSITETEDEISQLETRLENARSRLQSLKLGSRNDEPQAQHVPSHHDTKPPSSPPPPPPPPKHNLPSPPTHFLLLLSDSALPLGSFAFSSGLESYLAHTPRPGPFVSFLRDSISSHAATNLPFALAAHRNPKSLADLDDELDAATICTVARRASTAQGRALLSIWERSVGPVVWAARGLGTGDVSHLDSGPAGLADANTALHALKAFSLKMKSPNSTLSAHLAPLFGAVCRATDIPIHQAAYVFLFSHVKALVSAAVRASVFGPYQAQKVLAGAEVQGMMAAAVGREWETRTEEAGQTVPAVDLWVGRHELLYSRIFNS